MRPTELIQRNCGISVEPAEGCLGVLAEDIGSRAILAGGAKRFYGLA